MKAKTVQSSFLSGVIDQKAAGRVDTDAYNNGMLIADNVIVHHLGGVQRRPGLKFVQELPGTLTFLTPSSVTTPNGGTGANGYDQDESTEVVTTTNVSTVDPYVVIRYDLGSALAVSHADVLRINATGGTSAEFRVQYSTDDAVWNDFGDVIPQIDSVERTFRRTAITGGELTTVTAQYWRLVKVGGTNMGSNTITLSEFNLWADSGTVSNARLISFELSTEVRYIVALTDRSATLFLNGAIPANGTIPLPYTSADLPNVDGAVGEDALFITHEDYAPRYIYDEFSGEDFQTSAFPFITIPQYDYNDLTSPTPTSEVQVITFDANWGQGDTFQIELDGARTALISYAGDAVADQQTTTATNIAREVQKLYTVPGFDGVTCARTNTREYTVTFADASAKNYDGLMTVVIGTVVSTSVTSPTVTRTTPGVPRTEDVWSAARGYPRTVAFFGGRLYFGGTKGRLQSLFGSAVGDISSYELLEQFDADPIFVTLNSQQLNAINAVFSGSSLEIFTSGTEFRYIKPRGTPITPSDSPAPQTSYGARRIRPVNVDGATIFVQRLGKSIRDFDFDFEKDKYNSFGLSSLAPSLINEVADMSAWQGSATDEINLVFVVNGDGTAAVLNLRREADVKAWTSWTTDGLFKAVAATVEEVYFAVERTINGNTKLFLEQIDNDMYVDAGVNVTAGVTDNVVHLDGETCRVRLQNAAYVLNDQTGGTVTPSETAYQTAAIQVGLNFNPTVRPMPLTSFTPIGSNFLDKRRVKKVRAKVRSTLGLLVNGRPLPDRNYDIDDFDETNPPPFTGNHALEETSNWDETEDKLITFTQVDPLPMEILALAVDMESVV